MTIDRHPFSFYCFRRKEGDPAFIYPPLVPRLPTQKHLTVDGQTAMIYKATVKKTYFLFPFAHDIDTSATRKERNGLFLARLRGIPLVSSRKIRQSNEGRPINKVTYNNTLPIVTSNGIAANIGRSHHLGRVTNSMFTSYFRRRPAVSLPVQRNIKLMVKGKVLQHSICHKRANSVLR